MFWLKWQQSRKEAKGCVIFWQCFNVGTDWQSTRDAALSTCVCVCVTGSGCIGDGRNWSVRKGRRECQRGGEGNTEKCWEFRVWIESGEKYPEGRQGKRKKGGLTAHWVSGRAPRRQIWSCWWCCGWGGAAAETAGRTASLCSPLSGCCSPAACTHVHTHSETLFCKQHYLSGIKHITKNAYRTSILLRPQKHPSIRRLRLFLCIFKERRLGRCWNVSPSTLRTRFLLSSLKRTQKV